MPTISRLKWSFLEWLCEVYGAHQEFQFVYRDIDDVRAGHLRGMLVQDVLIWLPCLLSIPSRLPPTPPENIHEIINSSIGLIGTARKIAIAKISSPEKSICEHALFSLCQVKSNCASITVRIHRCRDPVNRVIRISDINGCRRCP